MEQEVHASEVFGGVSAAPAGLVLSSTPTSLVVLSGLVLAYALYYLVALVSRIDLRYDKTHPGTAALIRRCTLLKGRYWPSPWIFSGHLDVHPSRLFLI
jgi:hypothetical protein